MSALLLFGPTLSLLVLGAHFFRAGNLFLVAVTLGLIGLQFVRRAWVPRLLQAALILGAGEWLRTLLQLRAARLAAGEPADRMVVILGGVALVTLLSAFAFQTRTLRRHYAAIAPDR